MAQLVCKGDRVIMAGFFDAGTVARLAAELGGAVVDTGALEPNFVRRPDGTAAPCDQPFQVFENGALRLPTAAEFAARHAALRAGRDGAETAAGNEPLAGILTAAARRAGLAVLRQALVGGGKPTAPIDAAIAEADARIAAWVAKV